ncbi:MAG: diaminopimelate epimerase [Burkholderiales bacterium]|jgi:diaminopimelate epimerase|nr:diaminopimelate epimerase [Burkholderiales bacterium]
MSALSSFSFTKMHGLGNDFVLLDGYTQPMHLNPDMIRELAHRRLGVGCDQVLVAEKPSKKEADFFYRIYNSNGSEARQCGNGARCFAIFVYTQGLTDKRHLKLQTSTSMIEAHIEDNGEVSVDMGEPCFAPETLPFTGGLGAIVESLDLLGESVPITALSMGNPHAVQIVPNVAEAPVLTQGPFIETHVRFPDGVNAGYAQILDRERIRIRVWERGAGETLACGTGACAAVVTGIRRGLLDRKVSVETSGGFLSVNWLADQSSVILRGPATTTFEGTWRPSFT